MAQRGGKRPGAGRKPGKVGQAKRALSDMAKEHAAVALATLAQISQSGESEAARVSASVAILDRAYGKPPQALEVSGPSGGPVETVATFDLSKMTDAELDAYRTLAAASGRDK